MVVTSHEEIKALQKVGSAVAKTIMEMKKSVKVGMTTKELDEIGGKVLANLGAISAPKHEYDFPGYTCISINEEVAHGIPGERRIQEGDLINIDVSAKMDDYYADAGHSFQLPPYRTQLTHLCRMAQLTMTKVISQLSAGVKLNVIGKIVEEEARKAKLNIVKNLCSHGVGRSLHEEPKEIVHFYNPNETYVLKEGQVLTIEPFLSTGADYVVQQLDGWTLTVPDESFVAQQEHTIIITKKKPIIVTEMV